MVCLESNLYLFCFFFFLFYLVLFNLLPVKNLVVFKLSLDREGRGSACVWIYV